MFTPNIFNPEDKEKEIDARIEAIIQQKKQALDDMRASNRRIVKILESYKKYIVPNSIVEYAEYDGGVSFKYSNSTLSNDMIDIKCKGTKYRMSIRGLPCDLDEWVDEGSLHDKLITLFADAEFNRLYKTTT